MPNIQDYLVSSKNKNFNSLRKLTEILNMCNESEVYLCERDGSITKLLKYRIEQLSVNLNSPSSVSQGTRYLINELYTYLKEGGLLES